MKGETAIELPPPRRTQTVALRIQLDGTQIRLTPIARMTGFDSSVVLAATRNMSAAVRSHEAHTSIRSRAARVKNPPPGPAKRRQVDGNDRANVKAVLAAPWVVQWGQAQGEKLLRLVEEGCVGVAEYHKERERRKRGECLTQGCL